MLRHFTSPCTFAWLILTSQRKRLYFRESKSWLAVSLEHRLFVWWDLGDEPEILPPSTYPLDSTWKYFWLVTHRKPYPIWATPRQCLTSSLGSENAHVLNEHLHLSLPEISFSGLFGQLLISVQRLNRVPEDIPSYTLRHFASSPQGFLGNSFAFCS